MKPCKRDSECDAEESDLGAVALGGLMLGAIIAIAGIAQHHPVLKSIAAAYGTRPPLAPAATLLLGLGLIFTGCALLARAPRAKTRRR